MRHRFRTSAFSLVLVGLAEAAAAQTPIDGAFLSRATRNDGTALRLCIYPNAASAVIDRGVAQELADILLMDLMLVEKTSATSVAGIDFVPVTMEELAIWLINDCEGFLGVEHSSYIYPEWMVLSAPYAVEPYVLVMPRSIDGPAQLNANSVVVTQSATMGDTDYAIAQRGGSVFGGARRIPLPTTLRQLDYLREGRAEAALVWRPWVELLGIDSEFNVFEIEGVSLRPRSLGIAFDNKSSYFRSLVDSAIAVLGD